MGNSRNADDSRDTAAELAEDGDWNELKSLARNPALAVVWALPESLRFSSIMLATLALVLTPLGWRLSAMLFLGESQKVSPGFAAFVVETCVPVTPPQRPLAPVPVPKPPPTPLVTSSDPVVDPPENPPAKKDSAESETAKTAGRPIGLDGASLGGYVAHAARLVTEPMTEGIGRPVTRLFGPLKWIWGGESLSFRQWLFLAGGVSWSLLIWLVCGAILARNTVCRIAFVQSCTLTESIFYVAKRCRSLLLLPKLPLVFCLAWIAIGGVAGLLLRTNSGAMVAGIGWPLLLLAGMLFALFVALVVPLALFMVAAVVAEPACDEYEAFHRAFSYVTQGIVLLMAYILAMAALGTIGAFLIDVLVDLTLRFTGLLVGTGVGPDRWREILAPAVDGPPSLSAARIIGYYEWLAGLLTDGFRYAFLFSSGAALYLRFRYLIDETEMDEVHEPFQLPDVAIDALRKKVDDLASGDPKK